MLPLRECSDRLLNLIAGIFCNDSDATVVCSERLCGHCTVSMGSRTIFLDPSHAGLRDLLVGARVLNSRSRAERSWKGRGISPRNARRWVRRAAESLTRDFPNYTSLAGVFRWGDLDTWPDVAWNDVDLKPLDTLYGNVACRFDGNVRSLPGINMTGNEEDFAWMLDALASGRLPTEQFLPLRELPVATVRMNLTPTGKTQGPAWDDYQDNVSSFKGTISSMMRCFLRKAEADHAMLVGSRRRKAGIHIDSRRLVSAALAHLTGIEPAVFFDRERTRSQVFDPSRYLSIMAVDANSLRRGPLDDPAFSRRALATFVEVHKNMGVDFVLLSFSDQIVTLPDGRRVYVHVPCLIHDIGDRFGEAFYKRLVQLLEAPPMVPGEPACFAPLVLRTVGRWFETIARTDDHSYRRLVLAITRGMPRDDQRFAADDFLSRTADTVDSQLRKMKSDFEGVFDHQAIYLPRDVRRFARAGGPVAKSY
jgi:hypothetical protein